MSLRELDIKNCYETTGDKMQLLEKFYIPVLQETVIYYRIAGFFSSSSLLVASQGIEGLIKNGGKMCLLISPELSEQDYLIIKNSQEKKLDESLSIFSQMDINDFPKSDNLQALAWLLAAGRLEIKIVVPKNSADSLFHQKIGICYDKEGNMISFSGSINESARAWLYNIEEFKAFKSWAPGQSEYFYNDLKKFNSYWNNERTDVADVYDLPESFKKKIIDVKPRDINELSIMKKYREKALQKDTLLSLFAHQRRAIEMWKSNNFRLLMEMATGTGKTRTAIGCFLHLKESLNKFLVIVATPYDTLSRQWEKDVNDLNIKFDRSVIVDSTNSKSYVDLEKILLDLNIDLIDNAIIYTTHRTASGDKFINIVKSHNRNLKILFICDEVHGIGADKQREALLDIYQYRIGLSATPERLYDEEGTNLIRSYFGDKSFEFTIKDALNTINPITGKPFLNPFYYYPCFVDLTEEELGKYKDYSRRIVIEQSKENPDRDMIESYLMERAKIVKNACNKLSVVKTIIDSMNIKEKIKDTIIFSTNKQLEEVMLFLSEMNITRSKVTENESTTKRMGINDYTEREEIIDQFRKGNIQVLIGIKCLDEGIDIKNARVAILMASSTNPREYVQRVGRVIRTDKDKDFSVIYDLIVRTYSEDNVKNRILEKEAKRAMLIASNAVNYEQVKEAFERNGVILDGN